jgi:nucleolar protein 4
VSSKKIVTGEANVTPYGTGLYLNGRRILIDKAIDRSTAESFKIERDDDGKPIGKKIGKDRRNLYLKNEGRVEEGTKTGNEENTWEMLPQTDQEKRGRAHQEKSAKLRSPLFFINPLRLSIRNLSKHVDEAGLRTLIISGITRGLANKLVTRTDMIAHWRASGEMTMRDIMKKIADAEMIDKDMSNNDTDPVIPPFNEKLGIKAFVPSVYIDRDFESTKGSKKDAPSRGFGFVEFTHHAHALACLRELNNNPAYSAEYASGGRKIVDFKRRLSKKKGTRKQSTTGDEYADVIGDDGLIRMPRLIVEFTVENKMMARKQAERRSLQLSNKSKQRSDSRIGEKEPIEVKRKSRGAMQREKKRLKMAQVNDK